MDALRGAVAGLAGQAGPRLAHLVGRESPTGDVPLLNALADDLAHAYEGLGGTATRLAAPAGDHLLVEWPGPGDRPVLLLGHHDTVWPRGYLADHPYTVHNGHARGPGTFDMKGGLVAVELAVGALRRAGVEPAQPVRLLVIADEEIGSPDGTRHVREQAADARAVFGLEPPHPDGALKDGRRGVARVALSVTGREAHAGLDATAGINAIDELLDQLARMRAGLRPELAGCLNIGRIAGGTRANVVAGRASAELGLRFATRDQQERLLALAQPTTAARTGATVTAELLSHRPVWPAPAENPLLERVRAVAAGLGQPLSARPAGGAGDTNEPGSAGIPTLDGLGPRGRGAHSPQETVVLSSIVERAELIAALLATPLI